MRILHLFNRYLEKGGEEIFVDRLTQALGVSHEVRNLIFDSADWRNESLLGKISQPFRMLRNGKSLGLIEREVNEFRPDVAIVHNMFPVGSLFAYKKLADLDVPIVQYIHNFRPFSVNGYCWADGKIADKGLHLDFLPEILHGAWQNSRVKTACYACVIWLGHRLGIWKRITRWIAISEFMRNTFISAGIPADKIVTLRHTTTVNPHPRSQSAADLSGKLLFLGRLTEEKGLRTLAAAWKNIEAERSDGNLVICGHGPLGDWLKNELATCRRAEIKGFVSGEEKTELVESSSAFVIPSIWWEAFGLVTLEAYNASKPVLAAASGGLTETIVDGQTGWLHHPGDHRALAAHIHQLLDHPQEGIRRGEKGRHWLTENFDETAWLANLDGILREAADFRGGDPEIMSRPDEPEDQSPPQA